MFVSYYLLVFVSPSFSFFLSFSYPLVARWGSCVIPKPAWTPSSYKGVISSLHTRQWAWWLIGEGRWTGVMQAVHHSGRPVTTVSQAQRCVRVCIFLFQISEENTAENNPRGLKQLTAFAWLNSLARFCIWTLGGKMDSLKLKKKSQLFYKRLHSAWVWNQEI